MVYDIMVYERALHRVQRAHWRLCLFLVLAECVVELCVELVLVYVCDCSVSDIGGTPS